MRWLRPWAFRYLASTTTCADSRADHGSRDRCRRGLSSILDLPLFGRRVPSNDTRGTFPGDVLRAGVSELDEINVTMGEVCRRAYAEHLCQPRDPAAVTRSSEASACR